MISPKTLVVTFSSLIVFSCSWLYFSHTLFPTVGYLRNSILAAQTNHEFHAPKVNTWAELSKVEFDDLLDFLYNRSEGLGLFRKPDTAR